jgi:hypothetical protein
MNRASPVLFAVSACVALSVASRADAYRANVNRTSTNIHETNVNANRNVDVTVNRDVDVHGYGYRYDSWGHPVAGAAAVTATAVAVGTMVAALPSGCSAVNVGGVGYQRCGATYYQPVYEGTTVHYVVVNPP